LGIRSLWCDAFKKFDLHHKGKLSKSRTESARTIWARAEYANLKGLIAYFVAKLCKSEGSHNNDIRDIKAAYFAAMGTSEEVAVSVSEPAPVSEQGCLDDYPAQSWEDDEQGTHENVVQPVFFVCFLSNKTKK
jgi:hypothetical protein